MNSLLYLLVSIVPLGISFISLYVVLAIAYRKSVKWCVLFLLMSFALIIFLGTVNRLGFGGSVLGLILCLLFYVLFYPRLISRYLRLSYAYSFLIFVAWHFLTLTLIAITSQFVFFHRVRGNSMSPTYHDGQEVVVVPSWVGFVDRQRVVVIEPIEYEDRLIKRVVGVPGDTVTLRGGQVFVNSKLIQEEYLDTGTKTCLLPRINECPEVDESYVVPADSYFVLGDDRSASSDSRFWQDESEQPDPFLSSSEVLGVVFFP